MANTFKVFTIADVAIDTSTYSTIYTCASSTTGIVLSLNLCNKTDTDYDVTVKLSSDTANRTANNDGTNEAVTLLNEVVVPANTTLEVLSGQKIVIETTDVITIGAEAGSALDATLSVMEIT